MRIENLVPHIATGEEDNSFVGLKTEGNQIHFYFPESYYFDPDNFERDDFLDLLKTINIAKSFSKELHYLFYLMPRLVSWVLMAPENLHC